MNEMAILWLFSSGFADLPASHSISFNSGLKTHGGHKKLVHFVESCHFVFNLRGPTLLGTLGWCDSQCDSHVKTWVDVMWGLKDPQTNG
jgi:hypothetical protein